jgi:hypothetical protein
MHGDVTLFRQTMLSYAPGAAREVWAGTPAVLGLGPARDAWMMPPVADTPARLSAASACRPVPEMTDLATPSQWRDHLTTLFSGLLAGFDPAYIVGAADGYYLADTVSGGPLLTAVSDGTVWSYAACGGMSFKFAPVIARAIAAHAMAQPARLTGLAAIDQPRLLTAARRGGAA